MAGCASPTSSAGHPGRRAPTRYALTINPDNLMGAGHFAVFVVYGVFAASVRNHVISRPRILAWMRGTYYPGPADLALVHGKTLARPPMLSKAVFFSIRNRNPKLVSAFKALACARPVSVSLRNRNRGLVSICNRNRNRPDFS